ncbi:DUF3800 domain-containing protein [Nocardioides jensenii]|uniref:DUF3800 domain-containing protein n=1 Tax=Nocardioides jensenii TaxID=1843 RepID=UPI0008365CED|nr:DUF3800 domain-containing protein [Nocardioides jensenii]
MAAQAATFWIDESGARGSAGKGYVLAGVKTRHPDMLARQIAGVRDKFEYKGEFKFNKVTEYNFDRFAAVLDVVEKSDAHLVATVVDSRYNPFKGSESWAVQADLISHLIQGGLNRNEVAVAFMDVITTPVHIGLGAEVKRRANAQLQGAPLIQAVSLDSKCNDLLQLADMFAGAIRHIRFEAPTESRTGREKRRLARRVAESFDVEDLCDRHKERVNILTLNGARKLPRS